MTHGRSLVSRSCGMVAAIPCSLSIGCQKVDASDPVPTTSPKMTGEVTHLSPDARELGARFAEGGKKARLLMILSPS